jgi:mannose-6-phosphate isomerase-like protein (cupin superfamily)
MVGDGSLRNPIYKVRNRIYFIVMTIVRAADAPIFELPGTTFTGYASPSRGSADVCTWRVTFAPGLRPEQPHHLDRDEVFMVARGTITLSPDGQPLQAGDAAVVPAGQPIAISNVGDVPAEVYIAIPAGFTATMADGTVIGTPPWAR